MPLWAFFCTGVGSTAQGFLPDQARHDHILNFKSLALVWPVLSAPFDLDLEWASSKGTLFGLQACNMHKKVQQLLSEIERALDNGDFSGPGK
jgi:hypothetical protein